MTSRMDGGLLSPVYLAQGYAQTPRQAATPMGGSYPGASAFFVNDEGDVALRMASTNKQ